MIVANKYYMRNEKKRSSLDKNKKIIAFDCEYDSTTNEFKLLSVCQLFHRNNKFQYNVRTFFSIREFIYYIIENKFETIYSFNLYADLRFLLKEFINMHIQYKMIESNKILGCAVKIDDKTLYFKDFFVFALTSLEDFSTIMKCETKKYPANLTKEQLETFFKTCSIEELQHHCENDVKILSECIFKFRKLIFDKFHVDFMSNKIFSLASLSMKIYKSNFLKTKLQNSFFDLLYNTRTKKYNLILRENDYEFVRNSYKGGYTDCFSNELFHDIVSLDINSAHPNSATKINFPIGTGKYTQYFKEFELRTRKIAGFCEVEIDFSSNKKYFIPVIVEENNETKFKRCFTTIRQTITSIEMRYLMQHNIAFKFIKGLYFRNYDKTFSLKNFYETLYKERNMYSEDNPLRLILKIVMNSLYGKFGQKVKTERTENFIFSSIEEAINFCNENNCNEIKQINDLYAVLKKEEKIAKKSFMFISWASLITAQTRIQLLDMMQQTNAIYCDTDSVKFEKKYLPANFQDNLELGGWKLEKIYSEFRCIAPKFYAGKYLKNKEEKLEVKAKGIQKKFREQLYGAIIACKSEIEVDNISRMLSYRECCRNLISTYCYDNFVKVLVQNKIVKPKLKYNTEELSILSNIMNETIEKN